MFTGYSHTCLHPSRILQFRADRITLDILHMKKNQPSYTHIVTVVCEVHPTSQFGIPIGRCRFTGSTVWSPTACWPWLPAKAGGNRMELNVRVLSAGPHEKAEGTSKLGLNIGKGDHWWCLSGASIRYDDKETPVHTKCGLGVEKKLLEDFIRQP